MVGGPAFGTADLTNCERELIHLAGSIQPHGVLLALCEPQLRIVQASANCGALLGRGPDELLALDAAALGGDLDARLRQLGAGTDLTEPAALHCRILACGAPAAFEGTVHRVRGNVLLVELEPVAADTAPSGTVDIDAATLHRLLSGAIQQFSAAVTIGALADAAVRTLRDLIGYDRVMVYRFDPDGHGKIIAEARDPRLEPLLGHHYPASDIPQRARELYLRNRLRVLVDVDYEPAALVPRRLPGTHDELDMSLCHLRSMSPLHLQYLRNMGVTATLVISLVREGRLWGLVACHHYTPRRPRFAVRAAADLLAEVISTRIAAIENYAHAQVAIQVRRLEQRLIEATSTEGDWRYALFRNPRTLLDPVGATAAALFYDGEILTTGEAPSTPELRALMQWIDGQAFDGLFSCTSVGTADPALQSLTATASGVLAVKLSSSRPDYLMWLRREQLVSVTWAGDPTKPTAGDDPSELSPRRSFAAWSELVRGTALPWSSGELALARAFGASLIDIILQVNAVRMLIAEHQLAQIRSAMASSREAVLIIDAQQRLLFVNEAFAQLARRPADLRTGGAEFGGLFRQHEALRAALSTVARERHPWRGELDLERVGEAPLPVAVRAEMVPARDGSVLGYFLIVTDLTASQRASAARRQLEQSLSQVGQFVYDDAAGAPHQRARDELIGAILANANLAAMDIADGSSAASVAPLLEELEASTRRATELYARLKDFSSD